MALRALNSVGGFSIGETPEIVIAANGDISASAASFTGNVTSPNLTVNLEFSGNTANFSGNVRISNSIATAGIFTDNLYYANGQAWDLQEAAGTNTQVQFNNANNFGASANFTFNTDTDTLGVIGLVSVTGNANISDTVTFGSLSDGTISITEFDNDPNLAANSATRLATQQAVKTYVDAQITAEDLDFGGDGGTTGNVDLDSETFTIAGGTNITTSAANQTLTVNLDDSITLGNVTANGNVVANEVDSNTANIDILTGNTANFSGNVEADTFFGNFSGNISGNFTVPGANTEIIFNDDGLANASSAFTFDKATDVLTVVGNIDVGNADLGNLAVANYVNVANDLDVAGNAVIDGDLTVNLELSGNTANFNSITIAEGLNGNTATFNGNISALNADLGNLAVANYVNVAVDLDVAGNAVIDGDLTVNDIDSNTANIDTLTGNTANFSGNISALNANLGNLATANYVNVANDLNVIGNVNAGNLVGTLANGTSNVRIFNDANVEISSAGTANVVRISDTDVYVTQDFTVTAGNIFANGNITANSAFFIGANAEISGEANVGSVLTANITAPTGNLSLTAAGSDSSILLTPTGNGIVGVSNSRIVDVADPVNPLDATNKQYVDALAGEGLVIHTPVRVEANSALTGTYAQGGTTPTVVTIANTTDITFSAAHGLSVNDGIVFANTFNGLTGGEGYWVANVVDSTTITVKDDYFGLPVTGLTNGTGLTQGSRANPGVGATLTNSGANAALTVDGITLSTSDRVLVYSQSNGEENGIYTVTTVGDGSTAWVLTRATDFDKYVPSSSSGIARNSYVLIQEGDTGAGESYVMTAPLGEIIVGTDALTFTQFSVAGKYTGEDGIDVTGTIISANIDNNTTAIDAGGNIIVKTSANLTTPNIGDATFSSLTWNNLSNGNVNANNINVSNIANVALDLVVGGNAQVNGNITSNSNVIASNVYANTGNIGANLFVSQNGLTIAANGDITMSGTGSNISGANLVSANFFTGTLIDGTSNLVITENGNITLTAGGNSSFVVTDTGANVVGNLDITGDLSVDTVTANSYTANTDVKIGNTEIGHGTLTTSAITANQTIAQFAVTGTTGMEFIVKGEDSTGAKYSVATVTAVTDGTNVDFVTYATALLGSTTGTLAVNKVGSNIALQVTPSSSNSTVWTAQFRTV